MELWYLISDHHYICTKLKEISQRVSELLQGCLYTERSKGIISVNGVGGVMVLVLSASPEIVLYLYQVLSQFIKGHNSVKTVDGVVILNFLISELLSGCLLYIEICKGA